MAEQGSDPAVAPKMKEVVPRYLRPSSGSCHDLCKYGKKHVFEEKPWKSSRKRIAKPSHSELAPVEIFVSGKPKKEKHWKQELIDTNKLSPNLELSPGIKFLSPKPKISLVAKSHSPRRNASFGDNKKLLKSKSSSARKPISPDPPEVVKREVLPPSKQVEVPMQEGSLTDTKLSRTKKRTDYQSDKRSPSLRSKLIKDKVLLSSVENPYGNGRRNVDIKTGRKMTDLIASAKRALKSTAAPLSPRVTRTKRVSVVTRKTRSSKLESPMKNQNGLLRPETKTSDTENVPEKTLHVIETGTQSDSLDSISDDMSRGNSPSLLSHDKDDYEIDHNIGDSDELVLSDNRCVKNEKVEPVKENVKTLTKSRVILSEDKYRSPVKLKFRSGKVVDLMSDNNNPRRLKFRKRNVVGAANIKADTSTKTYKKIGNGEGATDAKLSSSEKVVLKHQDVRDKKDDLLLFNNVIEETASKLVKSRKSKVKALVGAFETVISLQEKTPLHPVS